MKLQDLITYLESKGIEDIVERLQYSYEIVVNRLRLNPSLLPVLMDSKIQVPTLRTGDPWLTKESSSEIIVKEIISIIGTTYKNDRVEECSVSSPEIGNILLYENGYGLDNFDTVNENHTKVQEVIYRDGYIYTGEENSFFLLESYIYPYPVIYGDIYTNEHKYSIREMIALYGSTTLEIDNTLGLFMMLETLKVFHSDNIRINDESMIDKFTKDLLNIYNENNNDILVSYLSNCGVSKRKEL